MVDVGPLEIIVILAIAILLFGPGRIGRIAEELGSGIREFRKGLKEPEEKEAEISDTERDSRS